MKSASSADVDRAPRSASHTTDAAQAAGASPHTTAHIGIIAGSYFVASFAALGLPPYLTVILPGLGDDTGRWAGILYVVPTVFSAVGAPLWGRLADTFGRKRLLLRAQLGLTVAFLLAGWADSIGTFAVALILQGILGGTFAASNGYLAATLDGRALSQALSVMQGAARAALVFAPIVVGGLSPWISPHRQYAVLAVLPLSAALIIMFLPESRHGDQTRPERREAGTPLGEPLPDAVAPAAQTQGPSTPAPANQQVTGLAAPPLWSLYALECLFVFSTVISFPYLVSLVGQRLPGISPLMSGVLFALPHLCYLLTAMSLHGICHRHPRPGLTIGFAVLILGLGAHSVATGLAAFVVARLLLGIGLTLGLLCLAELASRCARGRAAGGLFGSLEFFSKSGAVLAGVAAALTNAYIGPAAPLLVGAAAATFTVAALIVLPPLVRRSPTRPSRLRWSR
ncbi:Multidrug resistance protein MdtG [Austwickia sp. TVS 96-490-7B]|uniref:MFS transporter n=1 Tax=Austwickia sp. TVS 96-490-7B TaxID=2830843 RepID=UPI001C57F1E2|nr:MFS transporter [Austwickia sp. TVS 96-490-7B]MBW3086823.1 Multidrug resistance protein MdtG [Austwickia sp. TVS 96-490-7B]